MTKCKKCNTEMITRKGKHGEFLCCPKSNPSDNHGTISLSTKSTGQAIYNYKYHNNNDTDLDLLIQRQMMYLAGGRMSDLDLFVEGGQEAAEDDPYHWMNTREY